jgi:hypothetical protein
MQALSSEKLGGVFLLFPKGKRAFPLIALSGNVTHPYYPSYRF